MVINIMGRLAEKYAVFNAVKSFRIFIKIIQNLIPFMDLIAEYNKKLEVFKNITGCAMKVYNKYHFGSLESAYEAALKYLLELEGHIVERQVYLPIFWDDVQLDQTYRMDLIVDGIVIVELKALEYVRKEHRIQLWNYMNLTHVSHGMLVNFAKDRLYSEWYIREEDGKIEKVRLL